MRKIICVIIFVVTIIALQIGSVNYVSAGEEWREARGKAFECSMAGAWASPDDGSLATLVPLDPTGKRYSLIYDMPKPPRLTSDGTEYILGLSHGTMDKIGPNLYESTLYRCGVSENASMQNEMMIQIIIRGRTKFIDCDTRVITSAYQVYTAAGVPIGPCVRNTGYLYRIQSEPPCGDGFLPFPE